MAGTVPMRAPAESRPVFRSLPRAGPSRGRGWRMNAQGFFIGWFSQRERMTLLTIVEFVVALVAILIGAAFFTNAVEILGSRLGMGQGAVGSLLAAVGTALPESMIAIVAILEPVVSGGDRRGAPR